MKQPVTPPDGHVLITGPTSGIGLALAREFAARGRNLILVSSNTARLRATALELESGYGIKTISITSDLAVPLNAEKLFNTCTKRKLKVETLVNNAGIGLGAKPQTEQSLLESRTLFQLNCATPLELSTLFGKAMAARGGGHILNVASTAAYQALPYTALYAAGKAFLLSLSEAMHVELKAAGVVVTAVSPGLTDTNFFKHGRPKIPGWLYRIITPEQVAKKALRALEIGKPVTIPCFQHWLFAQFPRLLPRRWMLGLMRIIEKKRKRI